MKHEVLSLEELRKSRKPIRNVNEIHHEHLSPSERFAIWITTHVGTMGFFAIIFFWTLIWLTWNRRRARKHLRCCLEAGFTPPCYHQYSFSS